MLKSTLTVSIFSIIGVFSNFAVQSLLAYYFGTSPERDAYFASLTIPTYINTLFAGSFLVMFLPFLMKFDTEEDYSLSSGFGSAFMLFIAVILLIIWLTGSIFSSVIVNLLLPAGKEYISSLTSRLLQVQLGVTFFTLLTSLLAVVLNTKKLFWLPAALQVFVHLATFAGVAIFSDEFGIISVVYSSLAASAAAFIIILLRTAPYLSIPRQARLFRKYLVPLIISSFPLFFSGIFYRSTVVIERYFAARLPQGSLSYLGTATQLVTIVNMLIASSIATTSFPLLSSLWNKKELATLSDTFSHLIRIITYIFFPAIVLILINGRDIVAILFGRGAFRTEDTNAVYAALVGLLGILYFGGLGNIVGRMLYLSGRSVSASVIGCIEIVIYILLSLFLSKKYGVVGLAISTSIAAGINILLSMTIIYKYVVDINPWRLLAEAGKATVLCLIVYSIVYPFNKLFLFNFALVVRTAISALAIAGIYCLLVLKVFRYWRFADSFQFLLKTK